MRWFGEAILALLSALGITLLGGLLFLALLRPAPTGSSWLVIPARGGGEGLERELRGLMWLRGLEIFRCPVAIVDLGLNDQGRQLADRLCARWPNTEFYHIQELLKRWQT